MIISVLQLWFFFTRLLFSYNSFIVNVAVIYCTMNVAELIKSEIKERNLT